MNMIVNQEMAKKLEQSEIDCLLSRLSAMKEIEGNPMSVEVERFGNATAFSVKNIPGPSFNTVKGLQIEDEKEIDKIIDFYHKKEIPVRFEIVPSNVSPDLLRYLNTKGFYQSDFHTTLFTPHTEEERVIDESITIRKLKSDEFDLFAEIYTLGFELPSFLKDGVARNNEILYQKEGWTFYLASMLGEAVGIGVLFRKNQIGTLAAATTVPKFRNNGVQSALIKKRLNEAFSQDCKLLVGQARFASISQNNMERAGMRIAYTKAIWVEK
ncbi:GNAT family N-acetyltransferase [Bacillus sp. PS06]|uniref:GNAT family N-acetyltransferase n=1 Tax=Bacillus sp. PS06 TaxID=2764176 RepID=UPI001785405A|nr:GNAT family N-acetyltransferase [Bacillus sp. PS06]MBD8071090.1 GNAT family N-acetyltransferase [Bacillus sp. PS06]